MINRGGFKFYPAEVEIVLSDIPGVIEAAVVGRPDNVLGEHAVAFINASDAAVTEEASARSARRAWPTTRSPSMSSSAAARCPAMRTARSRKRICARPRRSWKAGDE